MLILQAESGGRSLLMLAVCDGMGGLAKGELASATMVRALDQWFAQRLPLLLERGFGPDDLWREWDLLVENTNRGISNYASDNHTSLGTTAVVLLLIDNLYYVMNVGDSRVYRIADNIYQLTKDQTVVQREIDEGRMTYEQALSDPNRSMLLQCIGATPDVRPAFLSGVAATGDVFMLCSDGFRHVILPEEFFDAFYPARMTSPEIMEEKLREITELNKERHEDDNISAVLTKLQ